MIDQESLSVVLSQEMQIGKRWSFELPDNHSQLSVEKQEQSHNCFKGSLIYFRLQLKQPNGLDIRSGSSASYLLW